MLTPPTDSLYKFVAISGLVVLAWGVAFPWQKSIDYEIRMAELKAQVEKAKNKSEQLNYTYQSLVAERKALQQSKDDPDKALKLAEVDKKKQQLYIELLEAKQPVDEQAEVVDVLGKALRVYKMMGAVSICVGSLLTLVGFALWYHRIQRHVDKHILKGRPET